MKPLRQIVTCAALALLTSTTLADNWPGWRGPTGNGLCTEKGLATEWSPTQNVAWKLPLPGPAGATPVVWGERVFLTSVNDTGELLLIAVGSDGKQLWQQVVASGNQKARGDEGNSASPSPVTDGKSVWTFMGDSTLGCCTVAGQEVWKFNAGRGISAGIAIGEGRLIAGEDQQNGRLLCFG